MIKQQVRNLIVDFGGVLINLNRSRCIQAFERLGFTDIEKYINPYYQQGVFMRLEKGEITPADFRTEIRRMTGKELHDYQIDEAWNSFLLDIPFHKLELLLKLREKYRIYLLSNTNHIHWEWACSHSFTYRNYQVDDFFDEIFLSYRLQQIKPEKDIFRTLLSKTGITPEETFFIDDAEANCNTAEELGIQTYMPSPEEDWSHLFNLADGNN